MNINDQLVDTKVAGLMNKVEAIRLKAKEKQTEALALGGYKTNCSITVKGQKLKISTLELDSLIEVGEFILQQNSLRTNALERLNLDKKISPNVHNVEGYSVDDWFFDLRICVLKREALILTRKADELEKKALALESDLNKRNRAADALQKMIDEDDFI